MSKNRISIQKHEDVGINSIRDLTKEELISCIEYMFESTRSGSFWFERGVLDIADKRREKKLKEEEAKINRLTNLIKEYEELIKPYRGRKLGEWPPDVIDKGASLERKIMKAKEEIFATFG